MAEDKSTKITILVDGTQGKEETAEVAKGFEGIAKSAQSSAIATTGALNEIEAAEKGLAANTEELLAIQEQLQASTAEVAALEERLAAAEQMAAAAAAEAAAAMKLLAGGMTEAGDAADLTAGRIVRVGVAASRVADVAIVGGRAMSTLAGAFNVASLGQIALIAGSAILVGEMLKQASAKEKDIELTYDQIKANQELVTIQATGNKWTQALAQSIHDENAMRDQLKQKLSELHIARANESDAIAHQNNSLKGLVEAQQNLATTVTAYIYTLVKGTEKEGEATAERQKAQKSVADVIDARVRLWAETNRTVDSLKEEISSLNLDKQTWDQVIAAIDAGAAAEAKFSAAHSALGEIRRKVAWEAADNYEKLTKASGEQRVAEEAEKLGKTELIEKGKLADENMKVFTEHVKDGSAAIRSFNNELANLKKGLEDARAAADPLSSSFDRQKIKIEEGTKALITHIENMKDWTRQQKAIAEGIVKETGIYQLEALNNKRIEAEQHVQDELQLIRIQSIENDLEREKETIRYRETLEIASYQRMGFARSEAELFAREKTILLEDELNRKIEKSWADNWAKFPLIVDKTDKEVEKFDDESNSRTIKEWTETFKKIAAVRKALLREQSAKGGDFLNIDDKQLVEATTLLNKLGLTVQEVDRHFGGASKSSGELLQRVQQLDRESEHGVTALGRMANELTAYSNALFKNGQMHIQWGQIVGEVMSAASGAISSAFAAMITGSQSAGAAIAQAMAQITAKILMELGTQLIVKGAADILRGIAYNADPLTLGMGTALIAAGEAEVAKGALLSALGGIASGLASLAGGGGSSAASASSAAGSTATAATSPASKAPEPKFINVPTAPLSAQERLLEAQRDLAIQRSNREALATRDAMLNQLGPITIEITLGPDAGAQFLTGIFNKKGVLTIDNAIGKNRKRLKAALSGI